MILNLTFFCLPLSLLTHTFIGFWNLPYISRYVSFFRPLSEVTCDCSFGKHYLWAISIRSELCYGCPRAEGSRPDEGRYTCPPSLSDYENEKVSVIALISLDRFGRDLWL